MSQLHLGTTTTPLTGGMNTVETLLVDFSPNNILAFQYDLITFTAIVDSSINVKNIVWEYGDGSTSSAVFKVVQYGYGHPGAYGVKMTLETIEGTFYEVNKPFLIVIQKLLTINTMDHFAAQSKELLIEQLKNQYGEDNADKVLNPNTTILPTNAITPMTDFVAQSTTLIIEQLKKQLGGIPYIEPPTPPEPVEPGNTPETAKNIATDGVAVGGEITPTYDHDWYKVNLIFGNTYSFHVACITLPDSVLTLRDSNGGYIFENDDGDGGYGSVIEFMPLESGIYYLDVQSYAEISSGTYNITASIIPPPDDNTIETANVLATDGIAVNGEIAPESDHDLYKVYLLQENEYIFILQRVTLENPSIKLMDSSGGHIDEYTNIGGESAILSFFPSADGHYFLDCKSYNNSSAGTYQISAEISAEISALRYISMNVGETSTLTVAPSENKWIKVSLSSGVTYNFLYTTISGNALAIGIYSSFNGTRIKDFDIIGLDYTSLDYNATVDIDAWVKVAGYGITSVGTLAITIL